MSTRYHYYQVYGYHHCHYYLDARQILLWSGEVSQTKDRETKDETRMCHKWAQQRKGEGGRNLNQATTVKKHYDLVDFTIQGT